MPVTAKLPKAATLPTRDCPREISELGVTATDKPTREGDGKKERKPP